MAQRLALIEKSQVSW